jgi:imidazoleglycerol-phosphate dehydratase
VDRKAFHIRNTKETRIGMSLTLDGTGAGSVRTTIPFMDHMLELFAKHGNFDLGVKASGDTHIDEHHLVEDLGIALGETLMKALGDKKGITRHGQDLRPDKERGVGKTLTTMDETLSYVALDLSGRPFFDWKVKFRQENKPAMSFELLEDFFQGLAMSAKLNLHVKLLQGRNNHHVAESIFKGFGRALAMAVAPDPRRAGKLPSTKGAL